MQEKRIPPALSHFCIHTSTPGLPTLSDLFETLPILDGPAQQSFALWSFRRYLVGRVCLLFCCPSYALMLWCPISQSSLWENCSLPGLIGVWFQAPWRVLSISFCPAWGQARGLVGISRFGWVNGRMSERRAKGLTSGAAAFSLPSHKGSLGIVLKVFCLSQSTQTLLEVFIFFLRLLTSSLWLLRS